MTTPPTNLSFEVDSGAPGTADSWALTSTATITDYAMFGPSPTTGVESFEAGWSSNQSYVFAFVIAGLSAASFGTLISGPKFYEDFEDHWQSNEAYQYTFAGLTPMAFASGNAYEDFEHGWANDSYLTAFTTGTLSGATYGAGAIAAEGFEVEWRNSAYLYAFGGGSLSPGSFYQGTTAYDGFETVRPTSVVTANTSTSLLNAPAHGFSAGDAVTVIGTLLPAPLVALQVYYVRDVTTNAFGLALTLGGALITLTTPGGGTIQVQGDPTKYWVTKMATV